MKRQGFAVAVIWVVMVLLTGGRAQADRAEEGASGGSGHILSRRVPASGDTALYVNPFEIVVTAPRLRLPLKDVPAAATVVGREDLRAMPRAVGAEEALATVPGVRIDNQADGSRVHMSIRGQGILSERGIRGIKVLLDGLPLNDPTGVAPDLYDVDWALVDRIEVLRGPSATLYGGGGSGGVVNIETAGGAPKPASGALEATGGSNGFWRSLAETGGTRENVNYRVALSSGGGDGWRDHTAFRLRNASEKVQWQPSPSIGVTQVLGWTDYFDQNAEGLNIAQVLENPRQANPDAGAFNEFYRTSRLTGGATGRFEISPAHEIEATGYLRATRFKESVPSSVRHRTLLTPGASLQYTLHTDVAGRRNHLSLGSDAQWQSIEEHRLANLGAAREGALLSNQTIDQRGTALFLLDRFELTSRWGVVLSGRYDAMRNVLADLMADSAADLSGEKNFYKTTAQAGLVYNRSAALGLYGNWGQGFLPPTTEELANNPAHLGGFNADLSPATSTGGELGARGKVGALSYELAGYRLDTDKDFDRYRMADRPLETFYRNLGSTRRNGFEAWSRYQPLRSLAAELAYTYSDFRYTKPDSIRDNRLPNSPRHQLAIELSGQPLDGLTLGLDCQIQTRWMIDPANSASVGGFTLWGARASYDWRIGSQVVGLTVAGRNLLARDYVAFTEPDPDGNSYQPGPKREIFAGLRVRV